MNADELAMVREAVLGAAALAPDRREEHLLRTLPNERLRHEARSLLAIDPSSTDRFALGGMERLAVRVLGPVSSDPSIGSTIGPYHLQEVLGVGGMGIVYRARQSAPFDREVAIKLLRVPASHPLVLRRFALEQQVLGQLDHPHIAKALDASRTDDGRPYFVLEYVDGVPIADHCRTHGLSLRDRLILFLQVCRAIDHAHRRGILHRDLKPSNILVVEQDGHPTAKIIDFGIARVLDGLTDDSTFATVDGQVLGTPHYMSPEQARGERDGSDTRSDLYSLGVILHELVTDALPYDFATESMIEALRVVAHEPATVSRRSTTGAALPVDLRTILECALAFEADRRYATVRHFADDIERYLDHEPLLARRPSSVYVLRKVAERHRVATVMLSLLLLFVAGAALGFWILYERESRALSLAVREADRREAVLNYVERVLAASRPEEGGADRTVEEVLSEAVVRARSEFATRPELRSVILRTLAVSLGSNDRWREAESALGEAFDASQQIEPPDHVLAAKIQLSLAGLARSKGDRIGAMDHARRGIAVLDAVQLEAPDLRGALLYEIGSGLSLTGQLAEAESVSASHRTLVGRHDGKTSIQYAGALAFSAEIAWRMGKTRDALLWIEESIRIRESSGETSMPEYLRALNLLGVVQNALGNKEASIDALRRAVDSATRTLGADHSTTATFRSNLATSLLEAGRLSEAEPFAREALRVWKSTLGEAHPNVASGYNNLGYLLLNRGRFAESGHYFARALSISDSLSAADPLTRELYAANLGFSELWQGEVVSARDRFRAAIESLRAIVPRSHSASLWAATGLGCALLETGDAPGARAICDSFLAELDLDVPAHRGAASYLHHIRERAAIFIDPRTVDLDALLAAQATLLDDETPSPLDLFEIAQGEAALRALGDTQSADESKAWLDRHVLPSGWPMRR